MDRIKSHFAAQEQITDKGFEEVAGVPRNSFKILYLDLYLEEYDPP